MNSVDNTAASAIEEKKEPFLLDRLGGQGT